MSIFDDAYKKRPFLFGKNATKELLYVIEKFNIQGNALELGCGDGRDTIHMLKRGLSVTAIDKSTNAISILNNRNDLLTDDKKRLNACCSDVLSFDYGYNVYDFAYAITLFDHLQVPNDDILLKKVIDSLKNEGKLFIKVHTIEDVGYTHALKEVSEFSSEIQHFYETNELLSKMCSYGHLLFYLESSEIDLDHGNPHTHVFSSILIRKE